MTGLILAAGGLLSAQAASAANNCSTSGYACLWGYDDYTKLIAKKAGGSGLTNLSGAGIANEAASWGNDSNYYGCLYDNPGGTGQSWTLPPKNSGWLGVVNRDRAESWKLNGTGC